MPVALNSLDLGCTALCAVLSLSVALQETVQHLLLGLGRIVHAVVPGLQEGVEHSGHFLRVAVSH